MHNRKAVTIFIDELAEKDFKEIEVTPQEIIERTVTIFQEENGLNFGYDLQNMGVLRWDHPKPPRFFIEQNECPLLFHLFWSAGMTKEIRYARDKDSVIIVFTGEVWAGSGVTARRNDGDGILVIGIKNAFPGISDWIMNRTRPNYLFRKLVNGFFFALTHPSFLRESKRDRYILKVASTCAHEQAHAFGIGHSFWPSVMSPCNLWNPYFDRTAKEKLSRLFNTPIPALRA